MIAPRLGGVVAFIRLLWSAMAHEGPHRRPGVMSAAHEADARHYIVVVSYIAKLFSRRLPTRPMQVVEDAG